MSTHIETTTAEVLTDLGDATVETKQQSPVPYYHDSVFGLGWRPN
jgi:hypothetical protein